MFPPVETADEDGVLCWGGEISPRILRYAYRSGVFPWPHEGLPLLWFAPPERGILWCDDFYLNARTRRDFRKQGFEIRINSAFERVMNLCGKPRRYGGAWETGSWVTPEIKRNYLQLYHSGEAHSVETWKNGELVGGLYGVSWGGYFCGESMFYRVPNASKFALTWLVERVQARGCGWIDTQLITPHFEAMGGVEVERADFMEMLPRAFARQTTLFD